jgi:hypothetical protein
MAKRLEQGEVRRHSLRIRGAPTQHGDPVLRSLGRHGIQERGLANARFTAQEEHTAVTAQRPHQQIVEQDQLLLTADQARRLC